MNELIVKLTQKLERGFAPWKEMFFEKEGTLNEMDGKPTLLALKRKMIIPRM